MQYSVLPKLFVTAISQILDKTIQHTTLTAYSLPIIPKSIRLRRPPNHHFRQKIQHFSGEERDKSTAQNSLKHTILSQKIHF